MVLKCHIENIHLEFEGRFEGIAANSPFSKRETGKKALLSEFTRFFSC